MSGGIKKWWLAVAVFVVIVLLLFLLAFLGRSSEQALCHSNVGLPVAADLDRPPDDSNIYRPGPNPCERPATNRMDCIFYENEIGQSDHAMNRMMVEAACAQFEGSDDELAIAVCPAEPGTSVQAHQLTIANKAVVIAPTFRFLDIIEILWPDGAAELGAISDRERTTLNQRELIDEGLGAGVISEEGPLRLGTTDDFYIVVDGSPTEVEVQLAWLVRLGIVEVAPVHVYHSHMMTRAHPVDDFESATPDATAQSQPIDDGAHTVFVVDANGTPVDQRSGPDDISGHGEFARGVVGQMGVRAKLVGFDVTGGSFFSEEVAVNAIKNQLYLPGGPAFGPGDVVNMSFGTYNCGQATELLTQTIVQLIDDGAHIVASAGNDERSELAFPAALAHQWKEVVFDGSGSRVDTASLHQHITSVGSVEDDGRTRSCFSNHGDWVEHWYSGEEVWAEGDDWRGWWSGTSFAAPRGAADIAGQKPLGTFKPADPPGPRRRYEYKMNDQKPLLSWCGPDSEYAPIDDDVSPA